MARPYPAFENATPETNYAYNYTYLPPLAMVQTVPPGEGFSSRPDWILQVALSALEVLINAILIDIRQEQGSLQYFEKLVKNLNVVAGQLEADAETVFLKAVDEERRVHGIPTTRTEFKTLLEAIVKTFAATVTEETLYDVIQIILRRRKPSARPTSLNDYNQLFQFIPLPAI